MAARHNVAGWYMGVQLTSQLDMNEFHVRVDVGRVRRSNQLYFEPDFMVVPASMVLARLRGFPAALEVFDDPLPLVGEIWSPSTGAFDATEKIPEYQARGDREIWLLHPTDRWVRRWVQQPDGSYAESLHRGGRVVPAFLPRVTIDLDALFALL